MTDRQGLKLVMAISHDGFVATGPADDMRWTPAADKEVFRLLTGVGGNVAVGHTTARHMPSKLSGRTLHVLSRAPMFGMSLGNYTYKYPGAWLAGGQTVAMEALRVAMVDEVHLCRNQVELGSGVADLITPFLYKSSVGHGGVPGQWHQAMETRLSMGGVEVEVWRRGA